MVQARVRTAADKTPARSRCARRARNAWMSRWLRASGRSPASRRLRCSDSSPTAATTARTGPAVMDTSASAAHAWARCLSHGWVIGRLAVPRCVVLPTKDNRPTAPNTRRSQTSFPRSGSESMVQGGAVGGEWQEPSHRVTSCAGVDVGDAGRPARRSPSPLADVLDRQSTPL